MNCRFTVRCSKSCYTTRTSFRKTGLYSLAEVATLGFAISLMTSARVALADCFLVFFLPTIFMMSQVRGRLQVNFDHANCLLACYGDDGVVTTFSSFRSSDRKPVHLKFFHLKVFQRERCTHAFSSDLARG